MKRDKIKQILKYVLPSDTIGYSRSFYTDEYEMYAWRRNLYIIEDGVTDSPASEYPESTLDSILKQLESNNYTETKWDKKSKSWITIDHKTK